VRVRRQNRGVTPAIKELEAAGVEFGVHTFDSDPNLHDIGRVAAEQLGLEPDQVFKTLLVAVGDTFVVAVVPVSTTVSLKAVGAATGSKRVEMADLADAERVTGYVRGGISPFGQRRRLHTLLDETAFVFDEIFVSGGRRGLDIGLAPADLVRVLDATVADIGA
jgi:Cys-tRNA(Pro)/Cys-tRNA(Cys) deacylase